MLAIACMPFSVTMSGYNSCLRYHKSSSSTLVGHASILQSAEVAVGGRFACSCAAGVVLYMCAPLLLRHALQSRSSNDLNLNSLILCGYLAVGFGVYGCINNSCWARIQHSTDHS
jgi:hypothetical protein